MTDTLIDIRTPIINQIEQMVEDVHGWSPIDQLYSLFLLVYSTSNLEGDIVEVGSWAGRSALVLGTAAKYIGNIKVHAIDYFPNKEDWYENYDDTYSFQIPINNTRYLGHDKQTVWKEPYEEAILPFYKKHPNLLKHFEENLLRNNLVEFVKPFKGNSELFTNKINENFKCRFLYLDGEHSYESVRNDITNLSKYLVKDGIICFDDAFTSYGGVDEAINELIIHSDKFYLPIKVTRKLFVAKKI